MLPVALSRCADGVPTTPIAPVDTPPDIPAPPRPSPRPTPPSPTGVVSAVPFADAVPIDGGFRVDIGPASPLATAWGCARTVVTHQGIGRYVLMMRTSGDEVSALSAVCTHEGCVVSGVDAAVFVCPCHGSRYDHEGTVVRGPAPAALPRLDARLDGEVLTVRFQAYVTTA